MKGPSGGTFSNPTISQLVKSLKTTLMMALRNGTHEVEKLVQQEKIVQLLVDNGADVSTKSENGDSALNLARTKGLTHIVGILEKKGAGRE